MPDASLVSSTTSVSLFPSTWPGGAGVLTGPFRLTRADHGGPGQIVGTVKVAATPSNLPVARRVRLFRDRDAVCIGEMWSDPTTGSYAFLGVNPAERYSVVSYDHTGALRAVIADNILPTPYP